MKRMLCLWLPNWPIQRLWTSQPELRRRPLVLFAEAARGQQVVTTCCPTAQEKGLRPGMPLAEAHALGCDGQELFRFAAHLKCAAKRKEALCVMTHDPAADRAMLKRLAWDCDRFAPIVGLEEADCPECLLLDVTGCGPVFQGEENLARQLQEQMQKHGLSVRIAVAGSIGLAWAVAHSRLTSEKNRSRSQNSVLGVKNAPSTLRKAELCNSVFPNGVWEQDWLASQRTVCVAPEEEAAILRRLPVELLRLSEGVLTKLRNFDLRTIGQLQTLPRESLPSRFGDELLVRLDQLTGRRAETLTPERRPEPVKACWENELPLREEAGVDAIIGELLRTIIGKLNTRGEGVQQLTGKFHDAEGKTARLSLELLRPSNDTDHLLDLLRLQWERPAVGQSTVFEWPGLERRQERSPGAVSSGASLRSSPGHPIPDCATDRPLPFAEGLVRISLECISSLPILIHQQSLLEDDGERDISRHRDALIERLSSRLGPETVLRPRLLPEPVPERAQEFVLCLDELAMFREGEAPAEPQDRLIDQSRSGSAGASPSHADIGRRDALRRPLWLQVSPVRIEVLSVVPDGPPYQFRWENGTFLIAYAWGPERITAGWWNGPHVRRDYYHVETESARRFWLYRDLKDHSWFLHATFD